MIRAAENREIKWSTSWVYLLVDLYDKGSERLMYVVMDEKPIIMPDKFLK